MPELRSYLKDALPRDLAVQIASYVRVQWPGLLGQKTPLWESTPYPSDGRHFVIIDRDVLISHALTHRKRIEHDGRTWEVAALSSVFTYPTHRGRGFGEQVVAAATEHLRHSGADLALLFCGERILPLYRRVGWQIVQAVQILHGTRENPAMQTGVTMGIILTPDGETAQAVLEREPVYVGPSTW